MRMSGAGSCRERIGDGRGATGRPPPRSVRGCGKRISYTAVTRFEKSPGKGRFDWRSMGQVQVSVAAQAQGAAVSS